jgi:hypothetical protein
MARTGWTDVADSHPDQDWGKKLSSYAAGGIPVYWIINLSERQVEVYSGPGPKAYRERVDYGPGQLAPVVIAGQQLGQVAVDHILPSQPSTPKAEGNRESPP